MQARNERTTEEVNATIRQCCKCKGMIDITDILGDDETISHRIPKGTPVWYANAADETQTKGRCKHKCGNCVLYSGRSLPIKTISGFNKNEERLVPSGWECCTCGRPNMDYDREVGDDVIVKCRSGHKSAHQLENEELTSTHRVICHQCFVINPFGERLCAFNNTDAPFITMPADGNGPVREDLKAYEKSGRKSVVQRHCTDGQVSSYTAPLVSSQCEDIFKWMARRREEVMLLQD